MSLFSFINDSNSFVFLYRYRIPNIEQTCSTTSNSRTIGPSAPEREIDQLLIIFSYKKFNPAQKDYDKMLTFVLVKEMLGIGFV